MLWVIAAILVVGLAVTSSGFRRVVGWLVVAVIVAIGLLGLFIAYERHTEEQKVTASKRLIPFENVE